MMRDILLPQAIATNFVADSKKQVLQEAAARAGVVCGCDAHTIFDVLWEREKLGSTGIGSGIAIPHGRLEGLTEVQGLFMRLAQPVAFDAMDEKPVDLVFALLAPVGAGADHLHALATISRLMHDRRLCDQLRRARDEMAIYRLLTETAVAKAA